MGSSVNGVEMQRDIVYVDIAGFAVTVERLVHPDLRGRPVVIASAGTPRATVLGLSREAWESGIHTGMAVPVAARACRNLIVRPPDEPLYARASAAVCRILQRYSPVLEPSGYGHAYVDLTGTGRLFGPARDAATRARAEIRAQLRIEASVGLASNKLVSRIAAVVTKPAGLQDIHRGDERAFLSPLPVRLLPGVGPRTQEQLRELNVRTVREVVSIGVERLTMAFGRPGLLLYLRAEGIDHTPVYPPRAVPGLNEEETLASDTNDVDELRRVLAEVCARAARRLRSEGQRAERIVLTVRYSDCRESSGSAKAGSACHSAAALYARAALLFDRVLSRRTRVRSLAVRLSGLSRGPLQLDLFSDGKAERQSKLEGALELLRSRGLPVFSCSRI
jgi:DNA polymerase IV